MGPCCQINGFGGDRRIAPGANIQGLLKLLEDRALTLSGQRYMHRAESCAEIRAIAAGHSAYFSKAEELALHIDEIARAR